MKQKVFGTFAAEGRATNKDQYSHFFNCIPSGGVPSTFFEPTSFQFVDSTVPFDSTYIEIGD